ncbi:MAG: ribose 5-phosphate isomerase B [Deltaproteobacteria bacterium]|jgi:ribose 5-phosphate isomerase B|nr:ribose 5-phosphate isomerase B [Deltaproteobacteria bacterium]
MSGVIAIGSDHAGPELKSAVIFYLSAKGLQTMDLGVPIGTAACNYPDIARKVVSAVLSGEAGRGILICGTGAGMCMVANKAAGIRAANCPNEYTARMARAHNDINILTLGARVLGHGLALEIVECFLETPFEGGRHQERLALFN